MKTTKPNKAARDAAIKRVKNLFAPVATAYGLLYDAGFADANKWNVIESTDDLPKVTDVYLITREMSNGVHVDFFHYNADTQQWGCAWATILAWRERPEPYRKETI